VSEEWQIEFYTRGDTSPVQDFLQNANLTSSELKQLQLRLYLLRINGLQLLRERSDILSKIKGQDNLYELRLDNTVHNPRIFLCALPGKRLILLHGFNKKSRKTPTREIKTSVERQKRLIAEEAVKDDPESPTES
jgi:phage-related protein